MNTDDIDVTKTGKMSFRKSYKTVFTTDNEQSSLELDESLGAGLEYDEFEGEIPTNVAFVTSPNLSDITLGRRSGTGECSSKLAETHIISSTPIRSNGKIHEIIK